MRRIDLLIAQSRRATENTDFTATSGIPTEEFLEYINNGQDQIQAIIFNTHPDVLQNEELIDAVVGQEAYNIPADAFLGNRIDMLEYSSTGNEKDFYLLKKGSRRERLTGFNSQPAFYIRRSGQVLLQPQPQQSGVLRLLYQRRVPRLDLRRATVSSVTLNTTTRKITSLIFDASVQLDKTELLEEERISIVDREGNKEMRRILITDINETTGVVTVDPSFTFVEGETIVAGDFALRGPDSTTHSDLPLITEKYLLEYLNLRILMRDSSGDSVEVSNLLAAIQKEIKDAFGQPDGEIEFPAIIDSQYLEAEPD